MAANSQRVLQDEIRDARSAEFLSGLESAHVEVETCIVGLESVMTDSGPTPLFSSNRLLLARANLARAQMAWRACRHVIFHAPAGEADALADLQKAEFEHSQAISEHIGAWPPAVIQDDWQGYRNATRKILERARELMVLERRLLLPLLRQAC